MQIDPITEGQDNFSPYHYSFNNPVRFSDPDGKFPECCGGVGDFLTGVGAAVNENMGWGNPVNAQPGFVDAYNNGRTAGNLISVVIGAGEVAAGALGITTSAGAEVASAGLATPVAAVTAAGSATLVAHGGKTAMNAIDNLTNDKGRVNADGKYSNLPEPRNVGDGKKTTTAQRQRILNENKNQNGGNLKSDGDGRPLNQPSRNQKGQKADMNQAEVDHVIPRSKNGSNSNANQRVISKEENLRKGNREQ